MTNPRLFIVCAAAVKAPSMSVVIARHRRVRAEHSGGRDVDWSVNGQPRVNERCVTGCVVNKERLRQQFVHICTQTRAHTSMHIELCNCLPPTQVDRGNVLTQVCLSVSLLAE